MKNYTINTLYDKINAPYNDVKLDYDHTVNFKTNKSSYIMDEELFLENMIKYNNDEIKIDRKIEDKIPIYIISGTVINIETKLPLKEACIKITDCDYNPLLHCFADCNGYFEVKYTFPPNIRILISKKDFITISTNSYYINDSTLKNLKFELTPSTQKEVIVLGTVKNNCLKSISCIEINLISCENTNLKFLTYTNNSGKFIFYNIPKGIYELKFNSPFYCSYTTKLNILPLGHILDLDTIYLRQKLLGGTLNGIIKDSSCTPLEDALVILWDESLNKAIKFTYTNSSGVYLFYNLKPGIYSILAEK